MKLHIQVGGDVLVASMYNSAALRQNVGKPVGNKYAYERSMKESKPPASFKPRERAPGTRVATRRLTSSSRGIVKSIGAGASSIAHPMKFREISVPPACAHFTGIFGYIG